MNVNKININQSEQTYYIASGIYDVSYHNNGATFESLSTLLGSDILSTLIPTEVRCGGMTIRFIQSSDNKYVQYRLMADAWSANTNDWAIDDESVYVENQEFVYVKTDSEGKILWAIKTDGSIYYGTGVPQQIIDYIEEKLAELSLNGYEDIVAFLDGLEKGNETIRQLLDKKMDGEYEKNPNFLRVIIDKDEKIIEATLKDGKKLFNSGIISTSIDVDGVITKTTNNPQYLNIEIDQEENILGGRDINGKKFEKVGFETPLIDFESAVIKSTVDKEGRYELKLDNKNKIISYRDDKGVLHENVGIKTPIIETNSFKLPNDSKAEVEEISKAVSAENDIKIKKYNLPGFGNVDIVDEIFYLTADNRYSDLNGVYLIRDYEDTDQNAYNHITLDYFYIKSTLTDNGDGTYSKNVNSVKLTFYAAGKVTNVSDKYYVTTSLGEGGVVEPSSIEVTQLIDVPHINAWDVNKKDEHYCNVTIDFGHYLSGTFKVGVKFQGSSTLNYRKKNFRFTFYKSSAKPYYPYDDDKFGKKDKIKIGEFIRLNGYNLKANATDSTRVKEAIMYRLIEAVWDIKGVSESYPWEKDYTAYTGATGIIKCFPIVCNVGGDYYGYDFFSLKKDGNNYILDKDVDGMFECGTGGPYGNKDNWTAAKPIDWEDELNDEEDWVIEN